MRAPAWSFHQLRDAADLVTLGALDGLPEGVAEPLSDLLRSAADDFDSVESMNAASLERAERLGGVDGQTYAMHAQWVADALAVARLVLAVAK